MKLSGARFSLRMLVALATILLPWMSLVSGPAEADDRVVPPSQGDMLFSFAPIVREVAPAVVNISATRIVVQRSFSPFMDDPIFRRFFGDRAPTTRGRQRMAQSLGSGVLISANGAIITNYHVIRDATEVKVSLADRREFDCEIVLKDERTDLAVLHIKDAPTDLPFVGFGDSDALEVGDIVLAIGNPFGVGQTVTQGIVSALARTHVGVSDYQFFIQTDAAINPGNSGGALIDMRGQLVGINSAIFSRSGGSNGIGFAIPSNMVRLVAEQGEAGVASVRRPWLGADLQSVTRDIAEGLGLSRPSGVLVLQVYPGGPADSGGLRRSDLIIGIDGTEIADEAGFAYHFATKGIEGSTRLRVLRGGDEHDVSVALRPAPETVPRDERTLVGGSPFAGTTIANLSPAVADEYSVERTDGVIIVAVEPGSPANRAGFQKGDLIIEVNGNPIDTTKALEAISRQRIGLWRLVFERDGRQRQVIMN